MPSSAASVTSSSAAPPSSSGHWDTKKLLDPPSYVTEAQQTLLYFRCVDADAPDSILGDVWAKQIINKINLDVVDTMGRDLRYVNFWCLRAKRIDTWCQEFIAENPHCTVLNLSCGLDTRIQRLNPPASVRWIDLDHPSVIEFRERVFPTPTGDYRSTAADITDPDVNWIYGIPNDRPMLVIAESNTFYLKPEVGKSIFIHIAQRFSYGQVLFDVLGSLCARLINMKMAKVQKNTGMKILWANDDPRSFNNLHPKLKFLEEMRYADDMPAWFGEFKTKILKLLPGYRNLGRVIKLGIGEDIEGLEIRYTSSSYTESSGGSSRKIYPPGTAESIDWAYSPR
ncbi:S-adenosyl-L-methionine-dependent methyltransferase [Xylariales sp. PMI_506]|nr:S-adenosyl-L-methionine-dependent methyltransferase [Xylariales sp. PMI_506]